MHDCIVKLLRCRPRTSSGGQNEDSLECACELFTTIGKYLDHEKAKVSSIRIQNSTIFGTNHQSASYFREQITFMTANNSPIHVFL